MALIALLSFSVGALLALRWNALMLLAAIGAVLPLVALIGIAHGEDAGSFAVDMLVTVTFIETGYIARLVAHVFVEAARAAIATAVLAKGADRLTLLRETARVGAVPRSTNTY